MRGKVSKAVWLSPAFRITPAYAGKSRNGSPEIYAV